MRQEGVFLEKFEVIFDFVSNDSGNDIFYGITITYYWTHFEQMTLNLTILTSICESRQFC